MRSREVTRRTHSAARSSVLALRWNVGAYLRSTSFCVLSPVASVRSGQATVPRTGTLLIGPLKLRNTSKFAFGGFMWFHVVSFSNPAHQPTRAILHSRSALPLGP